MTPEEPIPHWPGELVTLAAVIGTVRTLTAEFFRKGRHTGWRGLLLPATAANVREFPLAPAG